MGRDYMFSRRRRNFGGNILFLLALLMIFGFGMWMVSPDESDSDSGDIIANADTEVKEGSNDDSDNESEVILPEFEAYYLLKESDGVIKLFYYDEEGEERLIKVTDIPYELIPETDQKSFEEGIVIHDEEELDMILQDFES